MPFPASTIGVVYESKPETHVEVRIQHYNNYKAPHAPKQTEAHPRHQVIAISNNNSSFDQEKLTTCKGPSTEHNNNSSFDQWKPL